MSYAPGEKRGSSESERERKKVANVPDNYSSLGFSFVMSCVRPESHNEPRWWSAGRGPGPKSDKCVSRTPFSQWNRVLFRGRRGGGANASTGSKANLEMHGASLVLFRMIRTRAPRVRARVDLTPNLHIVLLTQSTAPSYGLS